jgi:hypothetical protein
MAAMREMAAYYDGLAHWCGRMAGDTAARLVRLRPALILGTRPGSLGDAALLVQSGRETGLALHFLTRRSRSSAKIGRRARLIREKIIGHSPHGFTASIAVFCRFFHHWVLALPHQPARQQSRRVLLQPGIQQLRNLLSEIGGMVQAREFVALQGTAGSGEQELPRGLGFVIQGDLRSKKPLESTCIVKAVKSTQLRTYCGKVCKSVVYGRGRKRFTNSAAEGL